MKKIIVIIIVIAICGLGIYYFCFLKSKHDLSRSEQMVLDFQGLKEKESHSNKFTDIDKVKAKEMIDGGGIKVIDISNNYSKGHLPGALNYYLGDGSLDKVITVLDKEAKYLVYSTSSESSITGSSKLINNGFKNVYRLDGNLEAWDSANYPIEFDFFAISGKKGSGKLIRSFDSDKNEYSFKANVKLNEPKDEKEFYHAYFFKGKPEETFDLGNLEKNGNDFILTYTSGQDFKNFDSLVITLNTEGSSDFNKEKIVLEARVNNF